MKERGEEKQEGKWMKERQTRQEATQQEQLTRRKSSKDNDEQSGLLKDVWGQWTVQRETVIEMYHSCPKNTVGDRNHSR